jgi:hypothetical protein
MIDIGFENSLISINFYYQIWIINECSFPVYFTIKEDEFIYPVLGIKEY